MGSKKNRRKRRAAKKEKDSEIPHDMRGKSYGELATIAEHHAAREMFSRGRSLPILYDLAQNAEGFTDALVQDVQSRNSRNAACKAGCSWCCNVRVTVTPPEVLTITSYLENALSEQEYEMFKNRVEAAVRRVYDLTADERLFARIPCPLLVNNLCSVYKLRPVMCRSWHSLDVAACEADYRDPSQMVPAPTFRLQLDAGNGVLSGLQTAFAEIGLDNSPLDLIPALHIALTVLNAGRRWMSGENVFEPAHIQTGLLETHGWLSGKFRQEGDQGTL